MTHPASENQGNLPEPPPDFDLGNGERGAKSNYGCGHFLIGLICAFLAVIGLFLAVFSSWGDGASGNSPGLSCLALFLVILGVIGALGFIFKGATSMVQKLKRQ